MRRLWHALIAMVIATFALANPSAPASAAGPAWWNASYTHRLAINVYANDAITSGYSLDAVINHTAMVAEGASMSNGNDIRIARFDGTNWTELDRVLAIGSSWNNASTKIVFKTQAAVSQSTNDTSYWLYYGNPGALSPPADANNVYALFDDFSANGQNTSKWTYLASTVGATVTASGGELVITGPETQTGYGYNGVRLAGTFGPGYAFESSFRSVAQSTATANNHKMLLGANEFDLGLKGQGSLPSRITYYKSGTGFLNVGTSSIGNAVAPYIRVRQTFSPTGVVTQYEDEQLKASRTVASPVTNGAEFLFGPENNQPGNTFDVRFDDIVIRKFVTYEPKVTIEQPRDVAFNTSIAPIFSFTVTSRTADCNGVPLTGTSTPSSLDLGAINASRVATAGQDLIFNSNARSGYLIQIRTAGPMVNQTGYALADMPGTRSSPLVAPGAGTEAFGYTGYYAASLDGSKFAAFKTTPDMFFSGGIPSVGKCIAVQASASPSTPPGTYTTTIVYTAIPTF